MAKKRIGKDYVIRWPVMVNGEIKTLVGMDLKLTLRNPLGGDSDLVFRTAGNIVIADFPASVQSLCGFYSLTLWCSKGKVGQTAVDSCRKIELVPDSCMEDDGVNGLDNDTIEVPEESIELGVKGAKGDKGTTFTPHVDKGVLSWTNPDGLENPSPSVIKGEKGDRGEQGIQGPRGFSGNINYPRFSIDHKMHLHLHCDTISDSERFKIENGHLKIRI